MNRKTVNDYKTSIMESYNYCIKIYNDGFESLDQFYSFKQLCQLHVDRCNFYYKKVEPKFGILQYNRYKMTKELKFMSLNTINELSNLLNTWYDNYEKMIEEAKLAAKAEEQLKLEHEIAMEYRDVQRKKDKKELKKTKPIGFNTIDKTKRKHTITT